MKVYYNSSMWSKGRGFWGLAQRTNWQFEYAGTKCYIPVIYRFSKGIVFDVITILDETKLRKFLEKYETIEETLTPLQQRCVEQEHPYQAVSISEIWINGKHVEGGYSSSGTMSIPWVQEDDKLAHVQKAYSSILNNVTCFACERFCVPYPPTDSKIQKLLRFLRLDRVNSIKLSTYPVKRFHPLDLHFEMSDENPKELCFNHPITGIKHTLYFQKSEQFSIKTGKNRNLYIMQSMYEIEPALPQGDTLQFGNSIQYTEPLNDEFSSTSAASIGIIGGADGPTAIYISSKKEKEVSRGLHGLPLHSCLSVPCFQKEETSHFVLEGINTKDLDSKEYNFQCRY
ncbi:MAG TPA: sodium ion-translocating decarboxylase subunit beta [Thermoanaerobacterales bacterium]|jgi:hypothetical protein|nr:sodium ion-translocating decarboxylase subunit beta [Thermoanaerobacterales bacterium]